MAAGAALHHPLSEGKNRLEDSSASYKPMFHYLTVSILPGQMLVKSHRLKEDFSGFEEGFTIKLALDK